LVLFVVEKGRAEGGGGDKESHGQINLTGQSVVEKEQTNTLVYQSFTWRSPKTG
jgi:hypothetical protein